MVCERTLWGNNFYTQVILVIMLDLDKGVGTARSQNHSSPSRTLGIVQLTIYWVRRKVFYRVYFPHD